MTPSECNMQVCYMKQCSQPVIGDNQKRRNWSFSSPFQAPRANSSAVFSDLSGAELAVWAFANLLGLVAGVIALEPLAGVPGVIAGVGDGAGVAIVGVDAAEGAAVHGDDVVNDDVPRAAVAVAVAAAPHDLAEVLGVEAADGDGADAVDLDDLVLGGEGAAAGDGHVTVPGKGGGILADVLPPNVGDGAGAEAVDALGLVGTDDHVGDGGTVREDEDGVSLAGLLLLLADDI